MVQEHRRHERQSVSLSGLLKVEGNPGGAHGCTIEDLSVGGARVRLTAAGDAGGLARAERDSNAPGRVLLEIEKFGAYPAKVVWTDLPRLGLKFQDPPETMADVLAGIALLA
jgi:hypothetical protein